MHYSFPFVYGVDVVALLCGTRVLFVVIVACAGSVFVDFQILYTAIILQII